MKSVLATLIGPTLYQIFVTGFHTSADDVTLQRMYAIEGQGSQRTILCQTRLLDNN
jgi:hypothetical protein